MYAIRSYYAWDAFKTANRFRRAIRHFNATPIPEEEIQALLAESYNFV